MALVIAAVGSGLRPLAASSGAEDTKTVNRRPSEILLIMTAAILTSNPPKINSKALCLVVQRSPFDTQDLGCFLLVTAGFLQDLDDVFPLHAVERSLSPRERPRRSRG